jgi:hypothetical protein
MQPRGKIVVASQHHPGRTHQRAEVIGAAACSGDGTAARSGADAASRFGRTIAMEGYAVRELLRNCKLAEQR